MALDSTPDTLPHSDEAERSVLGAVLLDNQRLDRAQELIMATAFYSLRHQMIYRAFEFMSESSTAMDLVTVKAYLERSGQLAKCGGPAYLASLVEGVPRSANIEHYVQIVKDLAIQRELIRASQTILSSALSPSVSTDQLLDDAEKAIFQVAENRLGGGFISLKVVADASIKAIEELTEREDLITGVSTSFPELDGYLAGMQNSDLIIIAARPAMGKTAFALNVASFAALQQKKTVGIFSLEMSHQQLFMRMLCAEGQIDAHRLRTGRIGKEDWTRIIKVYGTLADARVFIDDSPGVTVMEMRAKCRRLKREHGLDLLFIDYLQLMRSRSGFENRQQEITDISRSLKELAKELNIPVVALSQLSRAPEQRRGADHRPQLSDLRESGAIEQDADVVLFLFREEMYDKDNPELEGKAEVIIGKQRNGPTGIVQLNFIKKFTRFANPEYRDH
jgi:replicative DNA helicase